jgi:hypothetical protein
MNRQDSEDQKGNTVYSFIFTLLIDVMEVSEHLESGNMGSGVINNSL